MNAVHCPCCKRAWKAAPIERMSPEAVWDGAVAFVVLHCGVSEMELFGHRRQAHLVLARALLVWIVKTYTPNGASYPAIGRRMGGRDHTTIMHLWRTKIPELLEHDVFFRALTEKFAALNKETDHGDTRH